jgi:hypothetical protein
MAQPDPYSRLFWRFADEFPTIFEDDFALSLFIRLLRLADMAWPSAGQLPFGVKRSSLRKLEAADLIHMESPSRFRVRGMDKHRESRSQSAAHAARTRWGNAGGNAERNAPRYANGNAETMLREEKKEKTREDDAFSRMPPSSKTGLANLKAVLDEHGLIPKEAP